MLGYCEDDGAQQLGGITMAIRKPEISWSDFSKLDLRVGTVERAEPFPEAQKPAIKLWLNFGQDLGVLKTSAQITDLYQPRALLGRQLVAVVNFPAKQIANFMSECLVLGALKEGEGIVLLNADSQVPAGTLVC
jgi:tRNA-binding protein